MKKLRSFLVVAFLAIGFAASAQIITVTNITGITFQATFSNAGTPCPPSPIVVTPGFSAPVTVSCTPLPSVPDRVEVTFDDFTCTPPAIGVRMVALCNTYMIYYDCNNQPITVNYDCNNQVVLIF